MDVPLLWTTTESPTYFLVPATVSEVVHVTIAADAENETDVEAAVYTGECDAQVGTAIAGAASPGESMCLEIPGEITPAYILMGAAPLTYTLTLEDGPCESPPPPSPPPPSPPESPPPSPPPPPPPPSVPAGSLVLNGTNQQMRAGFAAGVNGEAEWTASIWVKLDPTASGLLAFFCQREACGAVAFQMYGNVSGGIYGVSVDGGSGREVFTGETLSAGAWVHVLLRKSGTNVNVRINNSASAGGLTGTFAANDSAGNVVIGQDSCGNYFKGKVADARIYHRYLSDAECGQVYAYPFSDYPGGVSSWWGFGDGAGTLVADAGTGSNPGTLDNAPAWDTDHP